ncbi:hypothetical protein Ciccas_007312 [Cichlidogyrus casuarinus]|uniref:Protein YIF1 n=1 Tax=Cichlidogyrus casuarinus TaxID=1844966 RepID=A0ABD2Q3A1_9PLAT
MDYRGNQQQQNTQFGMPNKIATEFMMQYGQDLVGQGSQVVNQKLGSFFSMSKIKYYFAVDNEYVAKKLAVLLFPFARTNWHVQFESNGTPVPPRSDVNAPDLYIPFMSLITYVLLSGIVLGYDNRFDPEQIGILSSQAVFWLFVENVILSFVIYVMNITNNLSYLDTLAYTSYKFVGMILILVAHLIYPSKLLFYLTFAWASVAIAFFLTRTLKVQILAQPVSGYNYYSGDYSQGTQPKSHVSFLLFIALIQPLMTYCLTSKTIFGSILF